MDSPEARSSRKALVSSAYSLELCSQASKQALQATRLSGSTLIRERPFSSASIEIKTPIALHTFIATNEFIISENQFFILIHIIHLSDPKKMSFTFVTHYLSSFFFSVYRQIY